MTKKVLPITISVKKMIFGTVAALSLFGVVGLATVKAAPAKDEFEFVHTLPIQD